MGSHKKEFDQKLLTLKKHMAQSLFQFAIVVADYDEAIKFYTEVLDFELIEDTRLSEVKRWVVVRPKGEGGCSILLAKAKNQEEASRIGNQTGGRVFLFLHTDSFENDHQNLVSKGVHIEREPVQEEWGRVLVFKDLYGNLWDLIEPPKA